MPRKRRSKRPRPSEKQGVVIDPFREGSTVEVAGHDESYSGSWYEAQVLRFLPPPAGKRKRHSSFLVQFTRLVLEGGSSPLTEPVPYERVRPLPPNLNLPIGLHDVVDAFLENGWWEGVVVRVLEESKRFCVFFKNKNPSDRVKEFDRSALRYHLEWVAGHWVKCPKEQDITCFPDDQRQNQLVSLADSIEPIEVTFPSGSCASAENAVVHVNSFERELEYSAQMNEVSPLMISTSSELATSPQIDEDQQPIDAVILHGQERITNMLPSEAYSLKGSQNAVRAKAFEATCSSSNPYHPSLDFEQCLPNITNNIWTLLLRNETKGTLVDSALQAKTSEFPRTTLNLVETDGQRFPFAKVSQVWEQVESLETFRVFPQNPHFHPLEQFEEFSREGLAIGFMIMFDNIVKEFSKLVIDDPRSKIDGMINGLLHLENHGFNVNTIKSRLTKLQEIKDKREQLLLKLKEVERKFMEHNDIKTKSGAELETAVEELRRQQEKIARLTSAKMEGHAEMAALKSRADTINRSMLENRIQIGELVAALQSGCLPDKNGKVV